MTPFIDRRRLLIAALAPTTPGRATGQPVRELRTAAEMRAFLEGAFPPGTPAAAVARRLEAEGIEHSPLLPAEGSIRAIWRDVGGGLLARRSVTAVLRFSTDGRLVAIEAEDVCTGL